MELTKPVLGHPVVLLCTGNAARSVMAGAALAAHLPAWTVSTAGTLVVEGQPMSWRTRAALEGVGLAASSHRSRQATAAELDAAGLVVALAPEHVGWVRRTHPDAADRTGTLRRLARDLPDDDAPLPERISRLSLATVTLEGWEEVVDPGGGDAEQFAACAYEIVDLVADLAARLEPGLQRPLGSPPAP
jgi:protein-tyrosine-phosphatase